MAKKLIALILAVMLVLSLMSPVYAVSKPIAATAADTRTVNVGVISYLTDELGNNGWQVHYWGGASDAGDADLTSTGKTEQKNVGYWDSAQTFGMYTASIPADATGFKVRNGNRWFGNDGTAGQKAYVFNYDGDKALYETDTTPEPSTAPATAADETITVYFEDTLSWGDIHVYYWPNGGDWPGKAATLTTEKYETPTRGTKSAANVYMAQIPASVSGVIFNGNGSQTVDITEGIADGAKWAPTGEKDGEKFKVKKVEADQPTDAPVETTAPTVNLPYHFNVDLVQLISEEGLGSHWFAWTWGDGVEGQWRPVEKYGYVAAAENVLFANFDTDVPTWNAQKAQTVDFKVEDGGKLRILAEKEDGKYKGTWVTEEPTTVVEPTEEVTEAPAQTDAPEEPTTAPAQGAYYAVGTFNGWAASDDYKLTAVDGADKEEYTISLDLENGAQFKVIYTDGETATWFPEGMDNNYTITADGKYDIYFRPNYDGNDDWYEKVLFVKAQEVIEPTEVVTPTEEVTEEVTEASDETTAPVETITVKFTDALYWGDVHVYYWDNGGEWPGKAMEQTDVNDYGQKVYSAEIPADVQGIIFNNNGKMQTVDIKDGIADGAWWYTVEQTDDQGHNYVKLVGEEPTTVVEPTEEVTEAPVETTAPVVGAYYVVGTFNNWAADDAYKLTAVDGAATEEYTITLELANEDELKVIYTDGTTTTWFPEGMDNNYTITADGKYDIYFRPNYDGNDDWYEKVLFVKAQEVIEPTETPTEEPTTAPDETTAPAQGAYYAVGTFNNWAASDDYKLTAVDGAEKEEYTISLDLENGAQFKVIYTDGETTTWFPEGMDNNYVITADGKYDIYFRPNYDGNDDWYEKVLFVKAQEVIEPTEVVTPTEEVTEEVTEASDETTAPVETITVKFTDALYWGDVHVYYWDNGGEWPGKAMEQTDVNDYGQKVYSAEIPADVQGIIFNNNGKMQTVDIKDGIADGAWWYTVEQTDDQGHNYVKLVGEEPTTVVEPTEEVTEAPVETTAPVVGAYYAVGTFNNWAADDAYKLTAVDGAEKEEYTITLDLANEDQLKVIYTDGETTTWFPEGMDNNYTITADGKYDIYFRPNYDGNDDWYEKVLFVKAQEVIEPTETPTEEPTTAPDETTAPVVGAYYVVGTFNNWAADDAYKLTAVDGAATEEYTITLELANEDELKVIYTDGTTTTWYPEGMDNNYTITADSKYDIYFRPNYDGNDDWYEKVLFVKAQEVIEPTETPTEEPTTAPDETTAPAQGAYYVVGTFNSWAADDAYKLTAVDGAATEEYTITLELANEDELKVIYTDSETTTWYPAGMDNNYTITADGKYDIYFRPNYDGNDDWYEKVLFVKALEVIEPTEVVTPTEEVTEEVTEATDETTAPVETITVKFTDAQYYGDANVYYWPNGGEWPGKAMTEVETNDFGQKVYTAEIPADVEGIIFNGNGRQTVDIKDGIADGAWWYTLEQTDDQGHNYVKLVGEEPTTVVEPTEEVTEVVEPTTAPAQGAYYVVGTFNNWTADDAYKLTAVDGADTEEYTITLELANEDQLKVIYTDGETTTWFPEGMDNNYTITADGKYDIYFRPNYDGNDDWYEKVLFVKAQEVIEPTEVVTPTEEVTEEVTEATDETTAPAETITVKFTDAQFYGDANVYYWPNGGEWPGKAMTEVETNDFGQKVYTAEIPANVEGIIFNGNGRQTVDIKDGIADGAWWYTVEQTDDQGHNFVKLVGEEPTEVVEPTEEVTEVVEPTTAPAQGAYYAVGTFNNWAADDAYKLTAVDGAEKEEYTITLELANEDQFKVIYTDGETTTWFPEGMDNNYTITADGKYDIYFRPNYDGNDDWYEKVLFVKAQEVIEPTETPTEEPTAPAQGAYYVVGTFNNWAADDAYKLTAVDGAATEEYTITLELANEDELKVIYTDGETTTWYPEGMDNNYTITADSKYDIYFRPNYDGNDDWYEKVLYVKAQEVIEPTETPTEEPTTAPAEGAYYAVGTFNNWTADDAYKLTAVDGAATEEYTITLELANEDELKVIYTDGTTTTWFPEGMDNNYTITADGKYDIYFRPNYDGNDDWYEKVLYVKAQEVIEPTETPTEEPTTAPDETTAPVVGAYYVVGTFNNWAADDAYKLTAVDGAATEEYTITLELANEDELKVIYTDGTTTTWYPEGMDNNYTITADGKYDIYFRPNYDGNDDWYEKVLFVKAQEVIEPTETPTDEPTTAPDETTAPVVGAYYVVGTFNSWAADDAYKLTAVDGAATEEYTITLELANEDELKVIYTDGTTTTWFPEGMDNNYTITADGKYDIYFRPNYDGNDDWYEKVLYVHAEEIIEPTEVVEPTEEVTEVVEPTTVPAEGSDYYLLGNMNGWTINEAYNLTKNAAADAEEYMIQVDLTTASQFKIVKLDGFKPVWYPTGSGNNYGQNGEITADGTYTIYFRPNYDGDESWFNSCIYASLDIPAPTTVVEPTEVTTEGGYYVVGNMTDWGIAEANKLTENEAAATKEYTFTMDLTTTSEFKVVYSEDGTTIKEWFPIGSENNYGQNGEIEADGTYDIYFRPNYDGTEDWFNGCIYVAIKETQPTEVPTEEPTTPTEIIWGDANGDGIVDITDATSIQRFLVDLATIDEVASDVDGDGEVSIVDVNWIQRALAGMDLPENVHVTGYPFD